MPSSVLIVVGIGILLCGVGLLAATVRLRRRIDELHRRLRRVTVATDEVERVEWAWRRLSDGFTLARGGASGVNEVVRRSSQAIAGIPYAILDTIGRSIRRDDAN